ncbi:MAG: S-layer homology domain-containing protein [Candidatus Ozemobacteraceae bacterium]
MMLVSEIHGGLFVIFLLITIVLVVHSFSRTDLRESVENWKIPKKIGFFIAFFYALAVVFIAVSAKPPVGDSLPETKNYNIPESEPASKSPFSSVSPSHWAYTELMQLVSKGLLQGYPEDIFKGEKHVTRYSLAMVTAKMLANVEQMMQKGLGNNLVNKSDLQSLEKLSVEFADELALLGVKVTALEDDMQVVKEDIVSATRKATIANYDLTRSNDKTRGIEAAVKKVLETRDRGTLPVEMKIPTTANSHNFSRNLIKSGEKSDFKGIFIYRPFFFLVQAGLALLGALSFLLVFLLSKNQHPLLSFFLFTGFAVGVFLLKMIVPDSQSILVLFFFLGFLLMFLQRAFSWLQHHIRATAVVLFLGIFLSSNQCFAELPQNDPRKERIIDLYVPYSQLGEHLPKDSDMVLLDFELYKYLKDLGIPKAEPVKMYPPVSVTFLDSVLEGIVGSGSVKLKFSSQIDLLGKGFKVIEFPHSDLGICSIRIDGEEVTLARKGLNQPIQALPTQTPNSEPRKGLYPFSAPDQVPNQVVIKEESSGLDARGIIISKKEGRVLLEAQLIKDLWLNPETKEEGFQIALPPFASGKLLLSINRLDQKVEIEPSVKVETSYLPTSTQVIAFLQPSSKMDVKWRGKTQAVSFPTIEETKKIASAPPIEANPMAFVDHEILFSINEGSIAETDNINLRIERAPAGEFLFAIPSGTAILNVTATDLSGWSVNNSSETQILRVLLNARRLENLNLRIEMEREVIIRDSKQNENLDGIEIPLDVPQLISIPPKGVIERQKGYFGISSRAGEELKVLTASGASIVDPLELPHSITQNSKGFLSHAFKFLRNSTPRIKIIKHKEASIKTGQIDEAKADTLVSNDGKFLTRLDLTVRNNGNQFLVFEKLKENQRLLSAVVNGEPAKPGTSKTGEVYLSLVRSRVLNKAFMPFSVTVFFEETIPVLEGFGSFDLALPKCSFDISEMNWRVFSSGDYIFFKFPGGFFPTGKSKFFSRVALGDLNLGFLNNNREQVRQNAAMSNMRVILGAVEMYNMDESALKNSVVKKDSKNEEISIGADGAGYFPVSPEIPETLVWQIFNKKLILGISPQISLIYFSKSAFQLVSLVFALLVGLLGSVVLIAGFRDGRFLKLGSILLIALGVSLKLIETGFGNHFPFLEPLFSAFLDGLRTSPFMALFWVFLSKEPKEDEEKAIDSEIGTQIPPTSTK